MVSDADLRACRIEVLGPVRVFRGARETTPPGRLQRSLIAALVAREDGLDNDELCRLLWDDPDQDARLHLLVHRTRAAVEVAELIQRTDGGYRLGVQPGSIDLHAIEIESDPALVLAAASREAFVGCRGEFFDEYRERVHARLAERRRSVLRALADDALVLTHIGPARDEAPYDEELAETHMRALARSGRSGEALAVFESIRRTLADELGTDPGERLRALHLRLLAGESADIVPAELPLHVERLVGRERELGAIDTAIAAGVRVAVITGMGGVGKTAIALDWAEAHRADFPDGILHADLRGFSGAEPAAPETVLRRFLRTLGAEAPVSRGLDELSALFRSVIDGRRMLIVLDNVRDEDQVRPLLPGARGGVALITSRGNLPGLAVTTRVHAVDVSPLDVEPAAALAAEHLGDAHADELARLCGGLPLAIVVAASSGIPGTGMPRSRPELLDLLDNGDHETSVEAVLSWSLDALDVEGRRLFGLLGLVAVPITVPALVALAGGEDPAATTRRIRHLQRMHLLSAFDGERVVQHDLVRDVARSVLEAECDPHERTDALRRLLSHYELATDAAIDVLTKGFESSYSPVLDARSAASVELPAAARAARPRTIDEAAAWLERERRALLDVFSSVDAEADAQVVRIILRIRAYVLGQSYLNDAGEIFEELLRRAARLGDLEAQASALRLLGGIESFRGGIAAGRLRVEEALRLSLMAGDRVGISTAYNNLGELSRLADDFVQADTWFQRALDENNDLGDVPRIALNLANLALSALGRGDSESAARFATEALAVSEGHGAERSRAVAFRALGEVELLQGRTAGARDAVRTADGIGRRIVYVEGRLRVRMLDERVRFAEGDRMGAMAGMERIAAEAGADGLTAEHRDGLRHLAAMQEACGEARAAARTAAEARALHTRLTRGLGGADHADAATRSNTIVESASATAEGEDGTRVTWEQASSSGS